MKNPRELGTERKLIFANLSNGIIKRDNLMSQDGDA